MIREELIIRKFGKKHVLRLSTENTLWDVIEMMHDFKIRHIPVVKGSNLLGVINPQSLMAVLSEYTDISSFDITADKLVGDDYIIVDDDTSIVDVIQEIARGSQIAALIMNDCSFHGIFTELDILNNSYLWSEIEDFDLTSEHILGLPIDEFNCVASDTSIFSALTLMCELKTDIMGIIDEESKILVGTLSFMDILHHIMYQTKDLGTPLDDIWNDTINAIFPQSGLYISEPIRLSELRQYMYDDTIYLTILLDQFNYPSRMISVHDLVKLYSQATGLIAYDADMP